MSAFLSPLRLTIAVSMFFFTVAVSSAEALLEGIWAPTKADCFDSDGGLKYLTFIDLDGNGSDLKIPLVDRYEHHCKINTVTGNAQNMTLNAICYTFWDHLNAEQEGQAEQITLSLVGPDRILLNGKSHLRCFMRKDVYDELM
jgi:hypothetical protein